MGVSSYLSDSDFAARTIMAPADVERLRGHAFARGVADTLATDVTTETPVANVEYTGNVVVAKFYPDNAVTADPANYATLSIFKRDAGGAQTLIAVVDTSALGWMPGVPVRLAIVAPGVTVDDTLTYAVTKHGTGVVVPSGRVALRLDVNFVTTRLRANQAYIDARLAKRYPVPFASPAPEAVCRWLADMTTKDCFARRGYNPTSAEDATAIDAPAQRALDELKEAADSDQGLFDLPIRDDQPGTTGISKGAPFVYSERSPYVAMDLQRSQGRDEDAAGAGSRS